jgi:hypothetical protein
MCPLAGEHAPHPQAPTRSKGNAMNKAWTIFGSGVHARKVVGCA